LPALIEAPDANPMLNQIISLLLDVAIGLVAGACLLRLYMQYQRIPMLARSGNPLGSFVFALTDWIVLPLRRMIPAAGRWDMSSLLATYLLELLQLLVLWGIGALGSGLAQLPLLALFGLARLVLSAMTGLIIVYAVISWMQAHSILSDVMERLAAPPLRPIRKLIPLVGGFDLSPLVLLVLLQIAAIVLGAVQHAVMR
jgi:YggT family protein